MRIRCTRTRNHLCRLGAAPSGDKRGLRPLPMFKEDFEKFAAMANQLVTADNHHYVCVLVGRAGRQGAGLPVEAGLTADQQVLHAFGNPRHNTWRVNKMQL